MRRHGSACPQSASFVVSVVQLFPIEEANEKIGVPASPEDGASRCALRPPQSLNLSISQSLQRRLQLVRLQITRNNLPVPINHPNRGNGLHRIIRQHDILRIPWAASEVVPGQLILGQRILWRRPACGQSSHQGNGLHRRRRTSRTTASTAAPRDDRARTTWPRNRARPPSLSGRSD